MLATLLPLAGYLLDILCMAAVPFLVFKAISTAFPSLLEDLTLVGVWIAIFLPLTIKNFPWLALISELPVSLPSSVYEMIVTLVGLAVYLVCMTGMSCLVLIIANAVCEASSHPVPENEIPPDWMLMIVLGAPFMIMDVFMKHSSHSHMIAMLFFIAGYLVHIVCMTGLPFLVFHGAMSAFSVQKNDVGDAHFLLSISIFPHLALKNFLSLALISEFPFSLPSSIFEMAVTLVGVAAYLVCMMGLSFLLLLIAIFVCEAASHRVPEKELEPNWMLMIGLGTASMVMDIFMNHSSHSTMMAILFFLASYLVYIVCMTGLPFLVFHGAMSAFSVQKNDVGDAHFLLSISIFPHLALKNFLSLALISEFPFSLPSSIFEMAVTLVGVAAYLVCMMGLSFLLLLIAIFVCEAASHRVPEKELEPNWMLMIGLGTASMVMDIFMNHSSHSTMMAILFFLASYLVYIVCMTGLPFLVFHGAMSAFSVKKNGVRDAHFLLIISIFPHLALKNFLSLALISEFPFSLPSSIFEMAVTLVGVAAYLVCMMGLSFLLLLIAIIVCEAASHRVPEKELEPNWMLMIGLGTASIVMDIFMNHSSHSTMMAMLFFIAGYLVYFLCLTGLLYLFFRGAMSAFQLEKESSAELFLALITISLLLALKNVQWLALISEFPSSLPFGVPEMIATVAGLAIYLACVTGLSLLVSTIASLIFEIWPHPEKKTPDWMDMITFGITVVVMDMFMKHSSHSNMIAMLLFAGYLVYILCMIGLSYLVFEILVFSDTIVPVLPSLLPFPLNYQRLVPMIVAGVILVLNDMHGLTPLEKPAFISESLFDLPSVVSGKLPGYLVYIVCTVSLSFFLLIIAAGAICRINTRWPMERPELMLTTIVGITFMLLNMMWGTPFEKPSCDSSMKVALVGIAGYLIYIICSMALSDMLSKSMMDAFVVSLTFVLLDMFSISHIFYTLVGLVTMIGTSVLSLFFLVAVSFVVSMGLHTWVAMLLPSAVKNYRELMFVSTVGVSYKVMKIMLDIPAIEKISILSNMKTALLGIADLRKDYHVAYLVIRYFTVLALPCLFMESRCKTSTSRLHATAAIIITLGLVLTMPLSPPKPIKDLALHAMVLDDIIQRTITSFITHTILILVTLIGGMVFYVQDQYPLWKLAITARYEEFKKDAGQEAKSFVNHLVYKSTLGCFGKKKVSASKRAHRR